MEMSLKPTGTAGASGAAEHPARPVRGPHGGWQPQEIEALNRRVDEANREGKSLRSAFEQLARELGRKPNSIRNFYYAQARAHGDGAQGRALPFEVFAPDEVERLVEDVLTARAQGMSVRACVRALAGGDRTRMLRYQNKYRSTVRTRPELVGRVMRRLSEQGRAFVSPYAQADAGAQAQTLPKLRERAAASGDPQLGALFDALEHLLDLALAPRGESAEAGRGAAEGGKPVEKDAGELQRRADRLDARCDLLRVALSEEQARAARLRGEAGSMATLVREYVALPEAERAARCAAFCRQAAERLSAVECALMEPEEK